MKTIQIEDLTTTENDFSEDSLVNNFKNEVNQGLSASNKWLSSKYIYNDEGSRLFSEIMELDEYYLTNSEHDLLTERKEDISQLLGNQPFNLIELGAGNGEKTKILLEHFITQSLDFRYIPVDISRLAVEQLVEKVEDQWPQLEQRGMVADYFDALRWLKAKTKKRNVILFLGSSIGNFEIEDQKSFLQEIAKSMREDDLFILGCDLKKDTNYLNMAYNDSKGTTEAFNKNLLIRINEELGADFDLNKFEFYASYNPLHGAVESFLISKEVQTVEIKELDKTFEFDAYEPIHTESSYKFSLKQLERMANETGFELVENLTDHNNFFVDSIWKKR